jgi:alkylhydroperoxidase/carboxymuconolactone decarboxylase family protein YurZ
MDETTSVLVCLGAAVAANCVDCFRHYHGEAKRIGLDPSEIEAAVTLGAKVKTGANIAVMHAVARAAATGGPSPSSQNEPAPPSCCSRQD